MEVKKLNYSKRENPKLDLGNMMFGKVPPQSISIETAVLGACLLEVEAFDSAAEILSYDCFYADAHQRIFKAMAKLSDKNQPIDSLTLVEQLKSTEELDLVGGPYFISKLTNGVFSAANIVNHCRIVMEKFIAREIIRVGGEMIQEAYHDATDAFELLGSMESKVAEIGDKNIKSGMVSINTVLVDAMIKINEWRELDEKITGVPTGFPKMDKATRGWQDGDLIILGARPSVGKTALALKIAEHAALNTIKPVTVGVWSLEMQAVFLALRMLSAKSKITLNKLQTGELDDNTMRLLETEGYEKLRKAPIWFDDGDRITLRSLRAKARKLKKNENLGLIIIDYLQLMEGDDDDGKNGNREREISKISRGLKRLAKELKVPIIALSQLTRDSDKNVGWNNAPGISSLRESGAIEQDADLILMLYGPNDEEKKKDPDLEGKRKLKIGKQRNGVLITEELNFRNEIQLYESLDQFATPFGFKPIAKDYSEPKRNSVAELIDDLPF